MELRQKAAAAALVATIALMATACGSSEDKPEAVSAPTGAPIKIGTICTCSGPFASSTGSSIDVLKAWVDQVNDGGGLNGHRLELFSEDVGVSPEKTLTATKKLVEQDQVVALVGVEASSSSAIKAYTEEKGIPVVGGYPYFPEFSTSPVWFASGEGAAANFLGLFLDAAAAGIKKIGLMYCAEAPVCAEADALGEKLAPLAGVRFTGTSVSASQPNYTAACSAFKDAGVDGLWIGTGTDLLPRIVSDCAKVGFTPRVVAAPTSFASSLLDNPAFKGSLWVGANANYLDTSIPGVERMHKALERYAPGTLKATTFTPSSASVYFGGLLFEAASAAGGGFTPKTTSADVIAALKKLDGETLEGTAPPLSFRDGAPGFPNCSFAMTISAGELVSENHGEPSCLTKDQIAELQQALAR